MNTTNIEWKDLWIAAENPYHAFQIWEDSHYPDGQSDDIDELTRRIDEYAADPEVTALAERLPA